MTTTAERRSPEWLDSWDPETNWDSKLAWRTLAITTYSLTLAFISWFLVSAVAPILSDLGFVLSSGQLFILAAMPGLAGGLLRMVWTFLPPILGTRKLVTFTTALLLLPLIGWAMAIQDPTTPYAVLVALAFFTGIGGGAFSGFMPSTSYFFPRSKQGTALGLQAGIGNFGVSIVQLLTPWLVTVAVFGGSMFGVSQFVTLPGHDAPQEVWYQNAGWFWVPFVVIGVGLSWMLLRSVPVKVSKVSDQFDIFRNKHTWIMTVLYVITFGTFSGFAAVFALLIKGHFGPDVFGDAGIAAAKYAFLGALVGSVARIAAGPVADRLGGGRVTVASAAGIAASSIFTATALSPEQASEFPKFLWGMLAIFFFAGVGNASTFKQMPMIFERRQAGGVIGWTSAIAAFGPFVFGVILAAVSPAPFFIVWGVFAALGAVLAWWFYARKGAEKPS